FFLRANNCSTSHMMKTDIKENKSDYQMFIELPEVKKEDTRITLENGYLKVTATLNKEDENDEDYIYRERSYGEFSRSYYVGDTVKLQDISAKLENGVLTVNIKKRSEKEIEKEHLVQIA
ncbi:Hsp20 family protein, partial [Ruminococcus sp.]|uniref:Hsp20 family protein n=1 Tax=Ruminococcus sp. TaxID=41978 RepID=UPI002E817373